MFLEQKGKIRLMGITVEDTMVAHKAYADALIQAAIAAYVQDRDDADKDSMIEAARAEEKASYDASYAYDKQERGSYAQNDRWHTSTAKKVCGRIQDVVWDVVSDVYDDMKAAGKLSYRMPEALPMSGVAGAAVIGAVGATRGTALSRRAVLGGCLALGALALVGLPRAAQASNDGYINQIADEVQGYASSPSTINVITNGLGAGIRG